jgi:predicted metal-dependent enzyme (double-stranded beta helix superfamily)
MTTTFSRSTLSSSTIPRPGRAAATRDSLSLADLATLVRSVADNPDLWQPQLRIPDNGDERWWTRLSADDRVDVWLLSWLPGHATELHDHGSSAAAFSVVRGRLVEVRADGRGARTSYTRTPGSVTWIAPGVIHDVRGSGPRPSVSIHAYSPPLQRMNFYGAGPRGLRVIRSVPTEEPEEAGG